MFDKRIFRCENGHEYESDKPIKSSMHQVMNAMLLGGKDMIDLKCNDHCKICEEPIISETDYKDDKIVAGAVKIK